MVEAKDMTTIICEMDSMELCVWKEKHLQRACSGDEWIFREKEKENEKENKISSFYAFSVLFCLVVSILSLVIGLILAFIGNGEASYICAAIFGVSFAAFLLGSWWKTTCIASKADWSDWGWL